MSKRVVMLLSNGLRSDPRVEKEAGVLADAGWDVVVLAWDREGALPEKESRGGWRVERLGPRARYGGGPRSLLSFREFWRAAEERAEELAPEVVHCHDLDTAPAGLRIAGAARRQGPALVVDFHELYGQSNMVPQGGVTGVLAALAVGRIESRVLARADAVLVANPGSLGHYQCRGADERLLTVENAPDSAIFSPTPRADDRPFTVGYFGQIRYPSELECLIDAVSASDGISALIAGGGTAAKRVATYAAEIASVEVGPSFAYEELPDLYRRVDAVYAVYDSALGNVRTLFPVKVMEAMACGLPSIVAEGTWIGEYVREHGTGIAVPAGDRDALAGALARLKADPTGADAMGKAGRRIVESGLNWRASAARLLEVYARL